MSKKYINKFHEFKFETDAKKDLEENSPRLSQSLSNEKINDDTSNESLLNFQYSAEAQKDQYNE